MKNTLNKIITISENLTNKFKSFENSIDNNSINELEFNFINNNISTLNDKYFPEPLSEIEIRYNIGIMYIYYIKNNKRHMWSFWLSDISLSLAILNISNKINDDLSDYMFGTETTIQTYKINFKNNEILFDKNLILPNIKLKIIIDPPTEISDHTRINSTTSYVYFNDNIIASMSLISAMSNPPYFIYSLNNINLITLYFNIYGNIMASSK